LGAHFGFWAALNVGLFVIDATYSGASWAWWPLLATGSLLALHWFLARRQAPFPAPQSAATAGLVVLPEGDPPAAAGSGPEPAPISIDVVMRTVKVGGSAIEVTPREFELLALLAQHPGRPFSRDDLLDRIWKNDYEVTDRTIDTHIQRLRRKLGAQAEAIETVWGIGYRFRAEEAS
jgi:two-component system alkaline phosphatase synthesis response regulator PhoP